VEAKEPVELVCLDTFSLATSKASAKVWRLTASDAAASHRAGAPAAAHERACEPRRATGQCQRPTSPEIRAKQIACADWLAADNVPARWLRREQGLDHFERCGWRGVHHHASLWIAAYASLAAERLAHLPF
jgi:hypothetical protein